MFKMMTTTRLTGQSGLQGLVVAFVVIIVVVLIVIVTRRRTPVEEEEAARGEEEEEKKAEDGIVVKGDPGMRKRSDRRRGERQSFFDSEEIPPAERTNKEPFGAKRGVAASPAVV